MKYVSFDSSSRKTGYAVFIDGELKNYGLIDLSKNKDSEDRLMKMGKEILTVLKKERPELVSAEHPQGEGRNVKAVNMLSEIIGVIRAYAIEKNIPFMEMNPSEWRKWCGLQQGKKKREELKALSIEFVKERFNIDVNDDVADAICQGYGVVEYYKGLSND